MRGFYEWNDGKRPTWFHRHDDGLVLLAGLFQPSDGRSRFTVLTTRPSRLVAGIHDRMPVIVPADAINRWLIGDTAEAARLIEPAPEEYLVATAVSTRVNSVKHDDPGCLAAAGEVRRCSADLTNGVKQGHLEGTQRHSRMTNRCSRRSLPLGQFTVV